MNRLPMICELFHGERVPPGHEEDVGNSVRPFGLPGAGIARSNALLDDVACDTAERRPRRREGLVVGAVLQPRLHDGGRTPQTGWGLDGLAHQSVYQIDDASSIGLGFSSDCE